METKAAQKSYLFVGNLLCLDFANTKIISRGAPVDLLESYEDVPAWLEQAGLMDRGARERCSNRWSESDKRRAFLLARRLRDALRETAERFQLQKPVRQDALDCVNSVLAYQAGSTQVVKSGRRYERRLKQDFSLPERLLVPIAESAAALLCDTDKRLVQKCENPECILFFYDTTKNHARRWCSMQACGNRMKVAAYWKRRRKSTPAG